MFNCPHCGRPQPDDSVFCEGCGQPISRYGAVQVDNTLAKKKRTSPVKVVLTVVVCIAVILGFAFCSGPITQAISGSGSSSSSSDASSASAAAADSGSSSSADSTAAEAESSSASETSATASSATSASTTSASSSNTSATSASKTEVDYVTYGLYENPSKPSFLNLVLVMYDDASWAIYKSNNDPTSEAQAKKLIQSSDDIVQLGTYQSAADGDKMLLNSNDGVSIYVSYDEKLNASVRVSKDGAYMDLKGNQVQADSALCFKPGVNGTITL